MYGRYTCSTRTNRLRSFIFYAALIFLLYSDAASVSSPVQSADSRVPAPIHCHGATVFEQSCAEKAAAAVKEMYQQLSFASLRDELPRVIFMDTVSVGSKNIDWALAIYDRSENTVRICHYLSAFFQDNDRFDGCSRRAVYYSILVHELAHFKNSMISPDLPPAVDEAIAGFVQYSLMDPALREHLLKKISSGFGSYRDVVLSNYINGPDDFLGSAYLYLKDHPLIIRRWLLHQEPLPKDPLFL